VRVFLENPSCMRRNRRNMARGKGGGVRGKNVGWRSGANASRTRVSWFLSGKKMGKKGDVRFTGQTWRIRGGKEI